MNDRSQAKVPKGKRLLMESATQLAAEQGSIHNLKLREIARHAGLNHNTFYRHFDSVPEMMEAMADDLFDKLHEAVQQGRHQHGDQPLSPSQMLKWLFNFARENRNAFIVTFRERYGPSGPVRARVTETLNWLRDQLLEYCKQHTTSNAGTEPRKYNIEAAIHQGFFLCMDYLDNPEEREHLLQKADIVLNQLTDLS